ncbi:MAG: phospholipid carrier-dependent glycosyltransferase, partial [Candidatus Omnitrophica bacterium]|nr:phospholipid carrier-dependent glycosyltransferase [Candidatus Omnitrophota bacterium]
MKINVILLIFIIILAFTLRIYGINWGLPSKDYYFSYQSDEVHYIKGLSQMNPMKLDFNPRYFSWGTWHYFELGISEAIAGFLKIVRLTKDKYFYYAYPWEMAKIYLVGRFLSVFFALGTILLVYLIGKKISNEKTALLTAFFLAINPAHILFSHYLKADISVTFWVTLLLFFLIFLLETGKLKWYILSGITSAFAVGTQHNGFSFIHSLFAAHCLLSYRQGEGLFINFKNVVLSKKLLKGYLVLIFTYLLVSPYVILSSKAFFSGIFDALLGREGMGIDRIYRSNIILDTLRVFNVSLTPSFLLLGILGIFYGIFSKSRKILLVLIWLLPYLVIMLVMSAFEIR